MMKTMIITGGSSGIGAAIVRRFLDASFQVFNIDMKQSSLTQTTICDVTDYDAVMRAVNEIAQDNQINCLISNAGMHFSANIEQTTPGDLEQVFNTNVIGAYHATKAVIPHLKKVGGSIIYIGSDQSVIGKPNSFAYNLSKHALASMAKTTALDYASFNVRANALCPGTIETPLYHRAIDAYCKKSGENKDEVHAEEATLQPLGRIGQPDEVANFALFLASDEAQFITGSLQLIDGGYTAQ